MGKAGHGLAQMKQIDIDILWQCLIVGGLGSVAGLAALYRSNQDIDRRAFIAAVLNSGLLACGIGAAVVWKMGSEHLGLSIFLSILAGLGGMSVIDFFVGLFRIKVREWTQTK